MLVNTVMATVGGAGVAFYLRFLLALCKDCGRTGGGCWMRLRVDENEAKGTQSGEELLERAA